MLRVRPNLGLVGLSKTGAGVGSATEAASIPVWLSLPLIDLSTAINSSWIGGSAFVGEYGNECIKYRESVCQHWHLSAILQLAAGALVRLLMKKGSGPIFCLH